MVNFDEVNNFIVWLTSFIPKTIEDLELICLDNLTDDGFKELEKMQNLKVLMIENCKVETIKNLPAVKKLRLQNCLYLSRHNFEFPETLIELEMDHCFLNVEMMKNLSKLVQLNRFYLDSEIITDVCFSFFPINLTELHLFHCTRITNEGLKILRRLKNLKKLEMDNFNNISDEGLLFLPISLIDLHLSLFNCSKITNEGLKILGRLKNLKRLEMRGFENISDEGVLFLPISLIELRFRDCKKITNDGLKNIINIRLKNVKIFKITMASLKENFLDFGKMC